MRNINNIRLRVRKLFLIGLLYEVGIKMWWTITDEYVKGGESNNLKNRQKPNRCKKTRAKSDEEHK